MDFLLFIGFIALMGFLQLLGQKQKRQREQDRAPRRTTATVQHGTAVATRPHGAEPKRRDLLEELRRAFAELEQGQAQPSILLPGETRNLEEDPEDIEDRESLEIVPVVKSLEEMPQRKPRVEFDQDDGAEEIVKGRLRWVTEHAGPITGKDHRAFDQRIRQPAPPLAAVAQESSQTPGVERLRQLMLWREILGPPVGLRDVEDR